VESSIPKLREVTGGTETKGSYQAIVCQPCVPAVPRTVRVGLTKVGNHTNLRIHLNIPKKGCISYQFRADIQTYGHRPQYTAGSDAAD
jgi:hypothetical protein